MTCSHWSSVTAGGSTCWRAGTCSTWRARGRSATPSSRWIWASPCRPGAWRRSRTGASTPPAASSPCPRPSTRPSLPATWTGSTRRRPVDAGAEFGQEGGGLHQHGAVAAAGEQHEVLGGGLDLLVVLLD